MKKLLFLSFVILVALSCREKNKVDVQNPVVASAMLNGAQESEYYIPAGSTFTFEVQVTDNMGLNQVQIGVHPAEDGHTHSGGGSSGGEYRLNSGKWSYADVVNVSGTTASHAWTLQVPDSIGGNWHIEISVLDEVGYTALPYTATIHVTNDNLPQVSATTIPEADTGGLIHLTAGSGDLSVNGTAIDPDGLQQLFIHLDNSAGTVLELIDIPIFGVGTGITFGPTTFDDPSPGNYRVVIEAYDSLGYHGIWDARLKVE